VVGFQAPHIPWFFGHEDFSEACKAALELGGYLFTKTGQQGIWKQHHEWFSGFQSAMLFLLKS